MEPSEQLIHEREIALKELDFQLRLAEHKRNRLSTPLILALVAAVGALASNAWVAWYNGKAQRELEERRFSEGIRLQEVRAQHERLLEIIKTGNVEKAAENLGFAVQIGLITDPTIQSNIQKFLAARKSGTGPALPPGSWSTTYPVYDTGTTYDYNYTSKPKKRP